MTRRGWLLAAAAGAARSGELPAIKSARPAGVEDIVVRSSLDGDPQHAWFLPPRGTAAAPMVVHLHSWSAHYDHSGEIEVAMAECAARGWAFVSPDFRGPNDRPQACASRFAIQDVLDAVAQVRKVSRIDAHRIYLLGGSGGGHMTLMMAQAKAGLWAAATAWVPITDLAAWHAFSQQQGSRYAAMLERCCGGRPGSSAAVDAEYRSRSPLFHLARAARLPIDIEVGIHDGHKGAVPVSQSLRAFNALAAANGQSAKQLSTAEMDFITRDEKLPPAMASEPAEEKNRKRPVLFRRSAGPVRITIFDGGHETDFRTAVQWLESQQRKTRRP
jgi:dipeptidyl aminopeptidase/acylaminoacyl peptidase